MTKPQAFARHTNTASTTSCSESHNIKPLIMLNEWHEFKSTALATPLTSNALRLIDVAGLSVDLSAQRYSDSLANAAQQLLQARNFEYMRRQLLDGGIANQTESRPAWHTALRTPAPSTHEVITERQKVNAFVRMADSERRWRNIIHIGIGGSDWGVRLAVHAFGYTGLWRQVHFVSNIDGHAIEGALAGLDPHDTLIVIASKSFTTTEALENGTEAVKWLKNSGLNNPYNNVIAVTANTEKALAWGVKPEHIFKLWDWVGGRYSVWSAVSITTALAVSSDIIAGMQSGAAVVDTHFAQAEINVNAPVQMALAGVINRSILGYGSLNIAPYDFRLANLVPYIQQLEMESLGKSVLLNGQDAQIPTGPAVWGMPGTDAQHTFFQWLHQSSDGAPVDFIVCQQADHNWANHHKSLLANCLAQREALLRGKPYNQALQETAHKNLSLEQQHELAHHKVHPGGRPSNLIVLSRLSPYTLGALIALYEHKVFTQAVIWGINPFDQWGVEYGKTIAKTIMSSLSGEQSPNNNHDASTAHWLAEFKKQFTN